jgi:hypothetical protein
VFTCSETYTLELNEHSAGENIHGPLFYRCPQYNLKVQSPLPNAQAYLRVSYEGPRNSYNAVILSQAEYNQRVLALSPELANVNTNNTIDCKLQATIRMHRIYYTMQHALQHYTLQLSQYNGRQVQSSI